jgi:hypothetical protein
MVWSSGNTMPLNKLLRSRLQESGLWKIEKGLFWGHDTAESSLCSSVSFTGIHAFHLLECC